MRTPIASLLFVLFGLAPVGAGESSLSGSAGVESRSYFSTPQFDGQLSGGQASLILNPAWEWESESRRVQFEVEPFLRLDGRDDERTHFDLREGYGRFVRGDWELLAGVSRIFWGVTESRHLVDVINQVDGVEDIDEEDRLGQPMLQLSWQQNWGRLDGFLLTGFRERTFVGRDGRPRAPLPIDTDEARYESGAEDRRLDFAVRYSHFVGDWDLGVSFFRGNGREPRLLESEDGDRLIPFYEVIDQYSADLQYTRGAWLWKLESLVREGHGDTFAAGVLGVEYTFYQLGKTAADLGILAELLRDGRDVTAPFTSLEDDWFVGSRLALNDPQDTQFLGGVIVDRQDGSVAGLLEAERRLGRNLKLELEGRWFANVDRGGALAPFEEDSFVTVRLSRYF